MLLGELERVDVAGSQQLLVVFGPFVDGPHGMDDVFVGQIIPREIFASPVSQPPSLEHSPQPGPAAR